MEYTIIADEKLKTVTVEIRQTAGAEAVLCSVIATYRLSRGSRWVSFSSTTHQHKMPYAEEEHNARIEWVVFAATSWARKALVS